MAEPRSFSRRSFLALLAGTASATLVVACGRPGQPTAPLAPLVAGSAEPVTADTDLTTPGVFNVWFSTIGDRVTHETLGGLFADWGQQNGVRVEWQVIAGAPRALARQAAAVAAGQPPELTATNLAYWYRHGELADLGELVSQFRFEAGGLYPLAIEAQTGPDGGLMGAPFAIDLWPTHWRMDWIGRLTGGRFFATWDELIELGPAAQHPPDRYAIAFALGHQADHLGNICTVLWSYGGRLADERGRPDLDNPTNQAGLETIVRLWAARVVPPDSFAQTSGSWNDESYQQGRAASVLESVGLMGWLLANDPMLAERTALASPPGGPAGAFAAGDALAVGYFRRARLAERAVAALEYFLEPANLVRLSRAIEGRFVPVYRDHASGEFWEQGKFAELKTLAEFGRVREWPAPRQPWLHDVQDARHVASDLLNKIIHQRVPIEAAQAWAQQEMMDSYRRLTRAR